MYRRNGRFPLIAFVILAIACAASAGADRCVTDFDCPNDSNICTRSRCISSTCQVKYTGRACDDGLLCTINDQCVGGECDGLPACPDQRCDELTGKCADCFTDAHCDDGDPCTEDLCYSDRCHNSPECIIDLQCDDGNVCTTDICDNGCCSYWHGDPCCPPDGCCPCEQYDNCFNFFGTCCNEKTGCCEPAPCDDDQDGILNDYDECPNTPIGTNVDGSGRPLADMNDDCEANLVDYALFAEGMTGPAQECDINNRPATDINADCSTDLIDLRLFLLGYTGTIP
jgi:hypothetical protein